MTNEETIEGNKLIAEFMGMKVSGWLVYLNENDRMVVTNLKYNSSWDSLMPVVEKISHIKIDWENATDTDTYYPRTFGMLQADTGLPMVRINANQVFVGATLIEATWIAVVEFIKDYNTPITGTMDALM